jgi:hypothetical protein
MEGVDAFAVIEQDLADDQCVLERVALALPGLKPVIVVDTVDLHLEMEVRPDLAPDCTHDLQHEARPLLRRPAVSRPCDR